MSSRSDSQLISDIREAIDRITRYVSGMTYDEFLEDTKTQDAVIRNIEIIGEATKRLSRRIRDESPDVPWRQMAGSRDRLIHDYFGVNIDIVWQIADIELPRLSLKLEGIVPDDRRGG